MSNQELQAINVLALIQNDAAIHGSLIRKIESLTKRTMVCYVANLNHPASVMVEEDDKLLETILRSAQLEDHGHQLDFLISSNGGFPEAAERLCKTMRAYASNVRVIIPKSAMSAATLLCFGADSLLMGETSELGPVDPQMILGDRKTVIPANDIINARERILGELSATDPNSPKIAGLLQEMNRIDPLLVELSLKAREVSKALSKIMLREGLLTGKPESEIEGLSKRFIEHGDQLTHGMGIRFKRLHEWGFPNVFVEEKFSELWGLVWELFVRCEVYVISNGFVKYFASRNGGLNVRVN